AAACWAGWPGAAAGSRTPRRRLSAGPRIILPRSLSVPHILGVRGPRCVPPARNAYSRRASLGGSDAMPENNEPVRLSGKGRIGQACDRCGAAWRAGGRPGVEAFRGQAQGRGRRALLRELLRLELASRRRQGEQPGAEEYRRRLPGDAEAVEAAFAAEPTDWP